ncbi:dGTP triphosphohydrolase [Paenibacillus sp. GP183]|jgi:dGTPase|uniref:deoxyguanosinetriphosphate triphosphohydrolase family protein n=1 Tax=Paenibacillus sp. GP183 TaxID=1882751 RepID=UPI000897DFC4|nr:dNTP triphosphohydrolase [Paenibacillus sp. GP183]SEC51543.1 dGTPase [Paenibacillus sp. GP183]
MDLRRLRLGEASIKSNEDRDEYEKDYARLIQSPAFRRLQGKSQVFGAGTGDYYRTRLTHSLEVAQIAREVAKRFGRSMPDLQHAEHPGLMIDPTVVECAALAHDFGHPPFGHKGEEVLNSLLMNEYGLKYEGNAQNFRILMFLEKRAGSDSGLVLTAAVLLGINKYPYLLEEEGCLKGVYASEWESIHELRTLWQMPEGCSTLEAQLMDLCDDIAYSTHDIEDGIRAGKIQMNDTFFEDKRLIRNVVLEVLNDPSNKRFVWEQVSVEAMVRKVLADYLEQWERIFVECNQEESRTRREMKARWVSMFANQLGILDDSVLGWKKVTLVKDGIEDIELLRTMEILKKLAWVTLIKDFRVQRLQKRSEIIVESLWSSYKDPEKGQWIVPPDWMDSYERHKDKWSWPRFIADYISGMTDAYAEKVYAELFGSKSGSIYEMD